ncbi:hypothetical protein BASA83_010215 [Batrachochytrium salamandrivorans]|nr:hypothetical protein BASA83_010215 [Batrachochytrium salamandrivorans]
MQVFWPDHLPPVRKSLWLVGWTSKTCTTVCVASTLPMSSLLDISTESGSSTPRIIGVCIPSNSTKKASLLQRLSETKLKESCPAWIYICMDSTGRIPAVSEVHFQNDTFHVEERYIVYYTRPASRSLQYYSTHPLVLDVLLLNSRRNGKDGPLSASNSFPDYQRKAQFSELDQVVKTKVGQHVDPVFSDITNICGVDIEYILEKINSSAMTGWLSSRNTDSHMATTLASHGSSTIGSFGKLGWRILMQIILYPLLLLLLVARVILGSFIWILNHDLPVFKMPVSKISTALYQAELRLQQLLFWPKEYLSWHTCPTKLSARAQAQYIGFFNTVWLIANDIIIGVALGSVIVDYRFVISDFLIRTFKAITIEWVDSTIQWLMGWPVGLKLNSELNSFIGELFGWLVLSWSEIFLVAEVYLPDILLFVGKSGILGATTSLSMLSDIIMLATMHLHLFYTISAKMYFWQLTVIQSLFTLFRGKKRNALRNRVDSADYDLDQLMLGTCFFTLLVFLMPTVAVYYALFTVCRICVVMLHAILEIILAILNHFPLFAVMLRFKDPGRLPEGIQFQPCTTNNPQPNFIMRCLGFKSIVGLPAVPMKAPPNMYLRLKSVPIGFSSIFYQYRFLYECLTGYHLSSRVVWSLFTGENIAKIPRLQYPTMATRFSGLPEISAIWEDIHKTFTELVDD